MSTKKIEGLDLSNYTEVNSICVIAITYVGVIILFNLCRPFNTLRIIVCLASLIFVTLALFIPEIASILGVSYQFNDLTLTNRLFTIAVILAILPIERALSDIIRLFKNKGKHENETVKD